MSTRDSVFLRALGERAQELQPEVFEYVAGPREIPGMGVGRGVFDIAGSPYRFLAATVIPFTGPEMIMTRFEHEVPFEIENRASRNGSLPVLRARREFQFSRGAQVFADRLEIGAQPHTLVNTLGQAERVQVLLECFVVDGNLGLRSLATRVRLGRRWVRLPRTLSMRVDVVDGWDPIEGRRTVDVVVRNTIFGVILRYRGWFTYEYC